MKIIQAIKKFFFERSVEGRLQKTQEMHDSIEEKIATSRVAHEELKKQVFELPDCSGKDLLLDGLARNEASISKNEAFLADVNMQLHILKTTRDFL